jgi:hypothetical protein
MSENGEEHHESRFDTLMKILKMIEEDDDP